MASRTLSTQDTPNVCTAAVMLTLAMPVTTSSLARATTKGQGSDAGTCVISSHADCCLVWMPSMPLNLLEPQDFQVSDGDDANDGITCFAYGAGR